MYELKNGILYKDGKKIIGLGVAYYASFHPKKVAVPENMDRIGEMKRDITSMKEAGFNMLRTAAIGNLDLAENTGSYNGEYIDLMLDEVKKNDMCSIVRIQGYSMRSKDYPDATMYASDGTAYNGTEWANFLNDSIHHKGVLADNERGTKVIAEHFKDDETVVGFLTYNEPHYPGNGVYDYNESSINDYREWLKKNNINLSDDLSFYQPPRRRPLPGERLDDWIYWRLFSISTLSDFLNKTAAVSKQVNTDIASMTCMTPNMLEFDNFIKGCDYYEVAEGMDLIGITLYKNSDGGDYYTTDLLINAAESAAITADKHLWLVEQDANVDIPLDHFNRQTYMAIGSGVKGLVWYQWRADYPFENSPEPNMFGLKYYDGTATPHYDDKIKMVNLLSNLSDYIVNSEKIRDGVAILYSPYGTMYADAIDNIHEKTIGKVKNTYNSRIRMWYRELKKENFSVDIVKSKHLQENKLGIKVLFVPEFDYLSEEEKQDVKAFQLKWGKVFVKACDKWQAGLEKNGFDELDVPQERYDSCYELAEALKCAGVKSSYELLSKPSVGINATMGENFMLLSLANISKINKKIENIKLRINKAVKNAVVYTPEKQFEVEVDNDLITVPVITDGAFLVVNFAL